MSLCQYNIKIGLNILSVSSPLLYDLEYFDFLTAALQQYHEQVLNPDPEIRLAAAEFLTTLADEDNTQEILKTIDLNPYLARWLEASIKSNNIPDIIKSVDFIFKYIYTTVEFLSEEEDDFSEVFLPFYNMIFEVITSSECPLNVRMTVINAFDCISPCFSSFFEEHIEPLTSSICELSALVGAAEPDYNDWQFPLQFYHALGDIIDHDKLYDLCVPFLQTAFSSDQFHVQAALFLFSSMSEFFHDRISNEPSLFFSIVQSGIQSDEQNIYDLTLDIINTVIYYSPRVIEPILDEIIPVLASHLPDFHTKTIFCLYCILQTTSASPSNIPELVQALLQALTIPDDRFKDDLINCISSALLLVKSTDESYGQIIGALSPFEEQFLGPIFSCYGSLAKVAPQAVGSILPRVMQQIIEASQSQEFLSYIPKPIQYFDTAFPEEMVPFLPNIFPLLKAIIKQPSPTDNIERIQNPLQQAFNNDFEMDEDDDSKYNISGIDIIDLKCITIECLSILFQNHVKEDQQFMAAQVKLFIRCFKDPQPAVQNHAALSFFSIVPLLVKLNFDPKELLGFLLYTLKQPNASEKMYKSFTVLVFQIINLYPSEVVSATFESFIEFFALTFCSENKNFDNHNILQMEVQSDVLEYLFALFNCFIEIIGQPLFQDDNPANTAIKNILLYLIKVVSHSKSKLFRSLAVWSLAVCCKFFQDEQVLQCSMMGVFSLVNEKSHLSREYCFRALSIILDVLPEPVLQNLENFKDSLMASMVSGSPNLLTASSLLLLKLFFLNPEIIQIPLPELLEKLITIPITNETAYQNDSIFFFQAALKILSNLGQEVPNNAIVFAKKMAVKVLMDHSWIFQKLSTNPELLGSIRHIIFEVGQNPQNDLLELVDHKESDMKSILKKFET